MARFDLKKSVNSARAAAGTTAPATAEKPTQKRSTPKSSPRGRGGQASKKAPAAKPAPQPVSDDIGTAMPDERASKKPQKNDKRVAVPVPDEMRRELAIARIDDDVETTVRIRAMIELWSSDHRLRARVDKLAKQRSSELISHRWPAGAGSEQ